MRIREVQVGGHCWPGRWCHTDDPDGIWHEHTGG
jgi:hypothetical protein